MGPFTDEERRQLLALIKVLDRLRVEHPTMTVSMAQAFLEVARKDDGTDKNPLSVSEVGETIGIAQSAASKVLGGLSDLSLIKSYDDTGNWRVRRNRMTREGIALVKELVRLSPKAR